MTTTAIANIVTVDNPPLEPPPGAVMVVVTIAGVVAEDVCDPAWLVNWDETDEDDGEDEDCCC